MARKSRKHVDNTPVDNTPPIACCNAAAYLRLSSDDTKKRGDSIETQRNIIENFVASTPGIRIVETYTDIQTSGTNFERPGFQRMLTDAQNGRVNCIIVKDISRFGRNAIDGGYYLEKYLPTLGVRFIAVTDQYDSNEPGNEILLPLMNIINESYALDIGRKVKAVHQRNIADGRFVGRLAPYGYKKAEDDCHRLIPDEETTPVVRHIYERASEGDSVYEIARCLSAAGFPTPSQHNLAKGYNQTDKSLVPYWQPRTVKGILNDKVYTGDMWQGKTKTVNGRQVKIDPSEWICVPGTHAPIVSHEMFEKVQGLHLEAYNKAKVIQQGIRSYTSNIFKGKVICDTCGRPMHRHRQNKDGIYWFRCESQVKYGKSACAVVSVKEAELNANIISTLREKTEMILEKFANLDGQSAAAANANSPAEIEMRDINRDLNNRGRYLKGLYETLVKELITPHEYKQMKSDYEAEIEALSQRADELRAHSRKIDEEKYEYAGFADAVSAAIESNIITEEVAETLIEKIIVRQDKSFDVFYYFDNGLREVA